MINQELVVDNFAGGGGASTGIEIATGVSVDKDRLNRTYAGFLKSIKQRPRSKHWWRRGKC